jgi:hypothetical protein
VTRNDPTKQTLPPGPEGPGFRAPDPPMNRIQARNLALTVIAGGILAIAGCGHSHPQEVAPPAPNVSGQSASVPAEAVPAVGTDQGSGLGQVVPAPAVLVPAVPVPAADGSGPNIVVPPLDPINALPPGDDAGSGAYQPPADLQELWNQAG